MDSQKKMPGIAKNISEILSSTHQHTLSTAILHLYKHAKTIWSHSSAFWSGIRNRLDTTSPCSFCISRCKSIFSSLADTYCIILLRQDPLKHNQKILPASHNAKQPIPYARLFRIFYTHQVSRDTAHHYSQIPPHLLTKMNSTCTLILIWYLQSGNL